MSSSDQWPFGHADKLSQSLHAAWCAVARERGRGGTSSTRTKISFASEASLKP